MSINITISGKAKIGKSTIGHLIAKVLTENGFKVELNEDRFFEMPKGEEDLSRRLDCINHNGVYIDYKILPRG